MRCNGFSDCAFGEDEINCSPNYLPAARPSPIWTLTDSTFDQALNLGQNVLVDFYAPWCKACVTFSPKYESAVAEAVRSGLDVTFAKVDTDQNPYLKQRFGINTFPRLLLFPRNGARPKRFFTDYGLEADNLLRWLSFQLNSNMAYTTSPCALDQFACHDNRACIPFQYVRVFAVHDSDDYILLCILGL